MRRRLDPTARSSAPASATASSSARRGRLVRRSSYSYLLRAAFLAALTIAKLPERDFGPVSEGCPLREGFVAVACSGERAAARSATRADRPHRAQVHVARAPGAVARVAAREDPQAVKRGAAQAQQLRERAAPRAQRYARDRV